MCKFCNDEEDISKVIDKTYEELQQENQELKKQIEYLKGEEYLNQLRFERNMLQDVVDKMEVTKEDKEFIDCTHRNTELLEENQQLKEQLELSEKARKEAIELINNINDWEFCSKYDCIYKDDILDVLRILDIDERK